MEENRAKTNPNSNSNLEIKDLFDQKRLNGGFLAKYLLFLYFPIGILLFILRFFIGLHAILVWLLLNRWVYARNLVMKMFSLILGLIIYEENVENLEKYDQKSRDLTKKPKILISNHVTCIDFFVINLVKPCFGLKNEKSSKIFSKFFEIDDFSNSEKPVLLFPEQYCTNGHVALLKFDQSPAVYSSVQSAGLIFLSLDRPFFVFRQISATTMENFFWADIFWLFFVPVNIFRVKFLGNFEKFEQEKGPEFVERLQNLISERCNIKSTGFTKNDVIEYIKMLKKEQDYKKQNQKNPDSPLNKIKSILPHIPIHVIEDELQKCQGSIDLAVSNLLKIDKYQNPTQKSTNWKQGHVDLKSFKDVFEIRKREMIKENLKKYLIRQMN